MRVVQFNNESYLDMDNGVYWDDLHGNFMIVSNKEIKKFIDISDRVGMADVKTLPVYHIAVEKFDSTKTPQKKKVALKGNRFDQFTYLGGL